MNRAFRSILLITATVCFLSQMPAIACQNPSPKMDNPPYKREKAPEERKMKPFRLAREGRRLVRGGDLRRGMSLLHRALALNEAVGSAYIGLGEAYHALGDSRKSAAYYRKVMYTSPSQNWVSSLKNDFEHLSNFSAVLSKAGEAREAQTVYLKAVAAAPDDVRPYLYLPTPPQAFDQKRMRVSLQLIACDAAEEKSTEERKRSLKPTYVLGSTSPKRLSASHRTSPLLT